MYFILDDNCLCCIKFNNELDCGHANVDSGYSVAANNLKRYLKHDCCLLVLLHFGPKFALVARHWHQMAEQQASSLAR